VIDAERRETSDGAFAPGTPVEVRNRFEGRWSRGFEVAEVVPGGYVVRRVSDAEILPVRFDEDDVRAERRRQGLWWA
jgi:hypothetical protein